MTREDLGMYILVAGIGVLFGATVLGNGKYQAVALSVSGAFIEVNTTTGLARFCASGSIPVNDAGYISGGGARNQRVECGLWSE